MKRYVTLLMMLATASLATVSCMQERLPEPEEPVPAANEVRIHFRMRTPNPGKADTRAAEDPEYTVRRVALLVFQQGDIPGEFLYQYTVTGKNLDQENNANVDFNALLRISQNPVRLLVVANYPDGLLDTIAMSAPESEVRDALTGSNFDFSQGIPMTGVKDLPSLSGETGVIRIPMMRSIAKATITVNLRPGTPGFTLTGVTICRANNRWQFFPDAASVDSEAVAPLATAPSIPTGTAVLAASPVPVDASQYYAGYLAESMPNPGEQSAATCMVVSGIFGGDTDPTYYRIDFGTEIDDTTLLGQVLRNFWYRFTIVEATSRGRATPEEAAANPASGLQTSVTPWNGGGNTDYYFGQNEYILLSADSLSVDAVTGHTDTLIITTSEVPFTITSIGQPGAGSLNTGNPEQILQTDNMLFTLTPLSVKTGQQKWKLTAYASTNESIPDYLNLYAANGLLNIRIPIRRNPPAINPNDPAKRIIRVYSTGGALAIGSMDYYSTLGIPGILRNTNYFGPTGTVRCGGFEFTVPPLITPHGEALRTALKNVDVVVTTYLFNPNSIDSQVLLDWAAEPGHVLFVTADDNATLPTLRSMADAGMMWFDDLTIGTSVPGYTGTGPAGASVSNAPFLNGPFGDVHACAIQNPRPYDGVTLFMNLSGAATAGNIIPLIVPTGSGGPDNNIMLLGIDPTRRIIYDGEVLMYHPTYMQNTLAYDPDNYLNALWSNTWAWIVNTVLTQNYHVPGMTDQE
ncbi:MAG: hypothetical protein LBR65_08880 [Culturomica sp.]|jgi:hypothetical protein|nr:hypothetical protein [Culturomica sp.]